MKKIKNSVFIFLLILAITACGNSNEIENNTSSETKEESLETKNGKVEDSIRVETAGKAIAENKLIKESMIESKTETKTEINNKKSNKDQDKTIDRTNETKSEVTKSVEDNKKKEYKNKNNKIRQTIPKTKNQKDSIPNKDKKVKISDESKKEEITSATETINQSIPYDTIDKYKGQGSQNRVFRDGRNGTKTTKYKVNYKNGIETSRKVLSSEITTEPISKIIERYVRVQDEKWETREVDNLDDPIYEGESTPRWFVRYLDGKINFYHNQTEAFNEYVEGENVSNWGTAEPEFNPLAGELIGYGKINKDIKVQEEIWEWKH